MAEAGQLAAGLAANLAVINADEEKFTVYDHEPPSPALPCLFVVDGPVDYDKTFGRGHDDWTFTVVALAKRGSDKSAQEKLRRLRASNGSESVKQLIEADKRLGGVAHSLRVLGAGPIGTRQTEGTDGNKFPLACEWTVLVLAPGNTNAS